MKHPQTAPTPMGRRWNQDTSEVPSDPFWEKHNRVEPTEAELEFRYNQKFRHNQRKDIYS